MTMAPMASSLNQVLILDISGQISIYREISSTIHTFPELALEFRAFELEPFSLPCDIMRQECTIVVSDDIGILSEANTCGNSSNDPAAHENSSVLSMRQS